MKLLRDLWNEKSSGLLAMLVTFCLAVLIANVTVSVGMDYGVAAGIVGAFLLTAAGCQIGQAVQGKPPESLQGVDKESIGIITNGSGKPDLGRILKLIAIVVAVELLILALAVRGVKEGWMGIVLLIAPFLTYAPVSDVTQKAGGI